MKCKNKNLTLQGSYLSKRIILLNLINLKVIGSFL